MNGIKAGLFVATSTDVDGETFGTPLVTYDSPSYMNCMVHLKLLYKADFPIQNKNIIFKIMYYQGEEVKELLLAELETEKTQNEKEQDINTLKDYRYKTVSEYTERINIIHKLRNIPLLGEGQYEFVVEIYDDLNKQSHILDTWQFEVKSRQ